MLGGIAHTKRLVRLLSVCWFFLYCGLLLFAVFFWSGTIRGFVESFILKPLLLIPAFYLGFCFCTSFARRRSSVLLMAGVLIHILLAVFVVLNASQVILGPVFILIGVYLSVVWFWMYSKLETAHAS
jgi:hypothetical protein